MRLIDADVFKKEIEAVVIKFNYDAEKASNFFKIIDNQPTVYNLDEVIEHLAETRQELLESHDYSNDIVNYCLDWFDIAIGIVKGGVVDD